MATVKMRWRWAAAATLGSVLILAAPSAAHAVGAVYGGLTVGLGPIVLETEGNRVQSLTFTWEGTCRDQTLFASGSPRLAPAPDPGVEVAGNGGGKFSVVVTREIGLADGTTATVRIAITGRFRRGGATGSMSAQVTAFNGAPLADGECGTGPTDWFAVSRRGQFYGGTTSQDQPVVVWLTRSGSRVKRILFGWHVPACNGSNFGWRTGDGLNRFRIRNRVFGDVFDQRYHVTDGLDAIYDYAIRGRFTRTRSSVSGRFTVRLTAISFGSRDESPVAIVCETGPVTFTAVTT